MSTADSSANATPEQRFEQAFIRFAGCFVPEGNIRRSNTRRVQDLSFLEGFGDSILASLNNMREKDGIRHTREGNMDVFTIPLDGPLQPELARFYCSSLKNVSAVAHVHIHANRLPAVMTNAEGGMQRLGRLVRLEIPHGRLAQMTNELNRVSDYLGVEESLQEDMTRTLNVATALDRVDGTKVFPSLHVSKESIHNRQEAVYGYRFDLTCDGVPASLNDNAELRRYVTEVTAPSPDTTSRDLTRHWSGADRFRWEIQDVAGPEVAESILEQLPNQRRRG